MWWRLESDMGEPMESLMGITNFVRDMSALQPFAENLHGLIIDYMSVNFTNIARQEQVEMRFQVKVDVIKCWTFLKHI